MPLEPGLAGSASLVVTPEDTAKHLRSGEVDVLGTPRVVALCEEATLVALEGRLGPGETTVGMRVQLDHLAPSAVGTEVQAEALLERVEGRRLTFSVKASDAGGLIAAGKVTRVVVETNRFMEKCC